MKTRLFLCVVAIAWSIPRLMGQMGNADWKLTDPVLAANGDILAITEYDDGTGPAIYIGGNFTVAGGVLANYVAKWTGENWVSLGGGLDGEVSSFAHFDGKLVAVGGFLTGNGPRQVAAWDGSAWTYYGLLSQTTYAAASFGGELVACGNFGVMRWNGRRWRPLGEDAPRGLAMVVFKDELYVASWSDGIMKWNGQQWSSVAKMVGYARAFHLAADGDLLMAGPFTTVAGVDTSGVARWDGNEWTAVGPPGFSSQFHAVTTFGNLVVAGGVFNDFAGVGPCVAAWDGQHWSALGNWDYGSVYDLLSVQSASGNKMYVGGFFWRAADVGVAHLASWDGTSWSKVGVGTSHGVSSAVEHDGDLIIAGPFTTVGNVTARGVARRSGGEWSSIDGLEGIRSLCSLGPKTLIAIKAQAVWCWDDQQWRQLGAVPNGEIQTLVSFAGNLVIGGTFSAVNDQPVPRLAAWDGKDWRSLGPGITEGFVLDLLVHDDTVLVGGRFMLDGQETAVARWDGVSLIAVVPYTDRAVQRLAVQEGTIFARTDHGVSFWSGSAWIETGQSFDELLVYRGNLVGVYDTGGSLWFWNGADWDPVAPGIDGWPNHAHGPFVLCLGEYDGDLIIGGQFSAAGGNYVGHLARFGPPCASDLDWDNYITLADVMIVLHNFGTVGASAQQGDLDRDGDVDIEDVGAIIGDYGTDCHER